MFLSIWQSWVWLIIWCVRVRVRSFWKVQHKKQKLCIGAIIGCLNGIGWSWSGWWNRILRENAKQSHKNLCTKRIHLNECDLYDKITQAHTDTDRQTHIQRRGLALHSKSDATNPLANNPTITQVSESERELLLIELKSDSRKEFGKYKQKSRLQPNFPPFFSD